ncbi:MAG: hypothetical protein GF411_20300 [Candidatus Lokiarchaeota archaeon]|nr:hypothetical protein [Candidatus Lokiarchaeota archaeon]
MSDIDKLIERLDRIEKRLDRLERKLDMQRRYEHSRAMTDMPDLVESFGDDR